MASAMMYELDGNFLNNRFDLKAMHYIGSKLTLFQLPYSQFKLYLILFEPDQSDRHRVPGEPNEATNWHVREVDQRNNAVIDQELLVAFDVPHFAESKCFIESIGVVCSIGQQFRH